VFENSVRAHAFAGTSGLPIAVHAGFASSTFSVVAGLGSPWPCARNAPVGAATTSAGSEVANVKSSGARRGRAGERDLHRARDLGERRRGRHVDDVAVGELDRPGSSSRP
jgi:hypothetical protein